jgi:hypothetical protein
MTRDAQCFEQDFLIVDPTEMRVRQGIQDTRLDTSILSNESERLWAFFAGIWDNEQTTDRPMDQEYVTVWESTLERL